MANENQGQGQSDGGGITVESIKSAGVPDTYIKEGAFDFAGIAKDLGELTTLRTRDADRAKAIPEAADKYVLDLPKDYKKPNGFEWTENGPLFKEFSAWAHKNQLTQAQFDEAKLLYANHQGWKISEQNRVFDEFIAKTPNGAKRHDAMIAALEGKGFGALLNDNATLEERWLALEKLANDPHRQASKGGNGADNKPDTSKMTARQKLDYANEQSMRAKH